MKIKTVKQYKESYYNFTTESDDGNLLMYNSKTGAFVAVPSQFRNNVESILGKPNLNMSNSMTNDLIRGGFIVEEAVDEFVEIRETYSGFKKDKTNMILTLLVSESCNFRCPYCFIYKKRGFNMKSWVYSGLLNLIEKSIVPNFELSISWFGGEPTLSHDQIIYFMEKLNSLAIKHHFKRLNYSMVTNGYLLTIDKFRQYIEKDLREFQITIDGGEKHHDKTRFLADGSGSFERIWNNLIAIKNEKSEFKMAIRVNFLKEYDADVSALIEKFNNEFGDDPRFGMYFRPIYNFDTDRNDINVLQKNIYTLKDGLDKQLEYSMDIISECKHPHSVVMSHLNVVPNPKPAWCNTEKDNFWVVGADGLLFKCDSFIGSKEHAVAELLEDGSISSLNNKYDWGKSVYDNENSKCFQCKLLPICQGGCPRIRMKNNDACYLTESIIYNAMKKTHNINKTPACVNQ